MLYYLAMIWNDSDRAQCDSARLLLRQFVSSSPNWERAVEGDGLAVYYRPSSSSDAHKLYRFDNSKGRGVVLGRLFERSYVEDRATHEFPPPAVELSGIGTEIIRSRGRVLVDRYWGQYVAFVRDNESRTTWALRDPSGAMPCQMTQCQGVDIYFVRVEDWERIGPQKSSINRHYVVGYMMFSNACGRETGLNEISNLMAGECITHHAGERKSVFHWNPLHHASSNIIQDPREAVRLAQRTVRACVHAWSSCFEGILHRLSGGLDSSIVLACLADGPTNAQVVCRNEYSSGSNSDERTYARHAAARANCRLIEKERNPTFSLDGLRSVSRTLAPFPCYTDPSAGQQERQWMQSQGLTAVFTGNGGDEIFYNRRGRYSAIDYSWYHGLSSGLYSVMFSEGTASHLSLWRLARGVVRYGILKRPFRIVQRVGCDDQPLLTAETKTEAERDETLWHPLYRGRPTLPPGKFFHAYGLTHSTAYGYLGRQSGSNTVHTVTRVDPLLSQPIIELFLRIPVYVLSVGGRDRAIARMAFSGHVPPQVIQRKTKGGMEEYLRDVIVQNVKLMQEMLLDGYLAQERLIDRKKLEEVLSGEFTRIQFYMADVLDLLSVEAWARSWSRPSFRDAA